MDEENMKTKSNSSTVSENQTRCNEVNVDDSKPSTSSNKNMNGDDWTERYMQILAEPPPESIKISKEKQIKLVEEQQKKSKEPIASRKIRLPVIKIERIHFPPPPKPPKENKETEYTTWRKIVDHINKEEAATNKESLRQYHAEKEIFAKIVKDNRTRDHYWKPDPLFYTYLRQLGYSKIAIERALFVVDNKSASAAKKYMDENPNCSELTKEEVIMEGEELLCKIRPKRRSIGEAYATDTEAERQIAEETPPEEDISFSLGSQDIDNITKMSETVEEVKPKDDEQRGVKRKHDGELVETVSSIKLDKNMDVSTNAVKDSQYEMIFINNTSLALDAVTLSLETGKVCVGLMDKLANGESELKRMSEKWVEDGSSVRIYRGINNDHLFNIQKEVEKCGYMNYLSIRPSYRFIKTPSPTVLGIFGEQNRIQHITDRLEIMLPHIFRYLNVN